MKTEKSLYIVLVKARSYWRGAKIARVVSKEPKLKAGEIAVRLELSLPENLWEVPVVPVEVRPEQIIRPKVEARAR